MTGFSVLFCIWRTLSFGLSLDIVREEEEEFGKSLLQIMVWLLRLELSA